MKLIYILSKFDNKILLKFFLLNIFFLINSFIQLCYVVSIFPVVNSFVGGDSKYLENISLIKKFFEITNQYNIEHTSATILLFALISLVANFSLIVNNYISFTFTNNILSKSRNYFYGNYLKKNYLDLTSKNLSFYNTNLIQQLDRVIMNVLGSINNILQQIFLISFLLFPLLIINIQNTLLVIFFLIIIFGFVIILLKKYFKSSGINISFLNEKRSQIINEMIKNFKEIKIFDLMNKYEVSFSKVEKNINNINKWTSFISNSIKPFLEISLILFGSFFIIFLIDDKNLDKSFFGILSVYIFAFYKLVPSFNSINSSINNLILDNDAVNKVHKEINKFENLSVVKNNINIGKISKIKFDNVSFNYGNLSNKTITNNSFELNKSSIYLIRGKSGSGKTTLLNILMGIIKPDSGKIFINEQEIQIYENKNWYKGVSYVPQKVNIFSTNIVKNISLFDNMIDLKKIEEICKKVDIYDDFKNRMDEKLSENAVNISGGQLQRIGIARALFRESDFIILDEPTSNLDSKNELKIVNLLQDLKKEKIIIVVSHKNIKQNIFDKTYMMENGKIYAEEKNA